MAEYESYKDGNGVTWKIVNAGSSMSAFVEDGQSPRYVPDAPDQGPSTKPSLASDASPQDIAERDRRTFSNLRELIDGYAVAHKANVAAVVTASPDKPSKGGWGVALVIVILAIAMEGKGRRR